MSREFQAVREFQERLPESRVRVPVRKPDAKVIPRLEALEILPGVKKEDLEKHYNLFTAEDTVKVSPKDTPEKLYAFFTTQVIPDLESYKSGVLRYSDLAQFMSDEFMRHIDSNSNYQSKFLDDPSLLGSTIYNKENFEAKRKFNTTERSFIDIVRNFSICLVLSVSVTSALR